MPKVSIIIPTFNRANLVTQAIESVLAQTFQDFEILVVDDGSTDNTQAAIEAISDARIRYIYQTNQGPGAARNYGIQAALGQYVAFLDADDLFLPKKLAYQVQALDSQPEVGLVAGGYRFVDETGQPLAERRPWQSHPQFDLDTLLYACPFTINSVLVRRTWLNRVKGFDLALRGQSEDWDLWLRLAYLGCRMAWTPYPVCTYLVHEGQRVRDSQGQKEAILTLIDNFFKQPDLPEDIIEKRQWIYASAFLSVAFREYGANQIALARQSLAQALELEPEFTNGAIPPLAPILVSWALNPVLGDPLAFLERVLENLPESASQLSLLKGWLLYTAAIQSAIEANLVGNKMLAPSFLVNVLQKDNLLIDNPTLVGEILVDCVSKNESNTAIEYINNFFDNLPVEWASFLPFRRKALGRLYMAWGFRASASGKSVEAAQATWQGVRLDPNWLRNRGVWSIMLRPWFKVRRSRAAI